MTRMKKTTTKKSSLRGSDLAWVLKADCSDFIGWGEQIGSLFFFSLWLAHWSMVCLCHFSVWAGRRLKQSDLDSIPPTLPLRFSSEEGVERLFWKPPAISCWFYTDPWPRCDFTPSTNVFCFPVLNFFQNVLSSPPSPLCWPIRVPAENNSATVGPSASLLL